MFRLKFLILLSVLVTACAPTSTPTPAPPGLPTSAQTATTQPSAPTPAPTLTPQPSTPTPSLTATVSPTQAASGSVSLELQPLVSGLSRPTFLTDAGDNSGRLFLTEQPGRIRIIANDQLLDQPFLDVTDRVLNAGNEQGLLSVAFSPDYATTRQFFIDYTRKPDGATIVARYNVSKDDPNVADPASAVTLMKIDQPQANHNGGQLQFGPDGYLYIGMGDGGGGGDQHGTIGNGQDLNALLGKILRIDVRSTDRYTVPASNPFGNEIWAYGLRNPWRFSFDRSTGDLYIADVGQNTYEEIDFQPASDPGGENYGWRIMEGRHCYNPSKGCDQTGLTLPVAEYSHDSGCSVTGGYVYRGQKYPQWQGLYFFTDYCSGTIWSLQRDASGRWQMIRRLDSGLNISSFGQDQAGELYIIGHSDGTIYRLAAP